MREHTPKASASGAPAAVGAAPPVLASTRGILLQAPPGSTTSDSTDPPGPERGPACAKLWPPAPRQRACTLAKERGLEDPEGRCDPELELVRPLGKVYSRAFDPVRLLAREGRGFVLLNWIKLEPLTVKNDGAREEGASIVELSTTGAPIRQCFATSSGQSGAATGIRHGTLDSRGRLAITGWIWGAGLSFGGESIAAPAGFRSSYLAVLGDGWKHVFSTRLGGSAWNEGTSVAFDQHGNVAVAGTFFKSLTLGALDVGPVESSPSLYVAKFDARGRPAWVHVSPLGAQGIAPAVTFLDNGNVLVVGGYDQSLDFGTPLPGATPLELSNCADERRVVPGRRLFWVELDAEGRQRRADAFGDQYATAFDAVTSMEGDVVLNGLFRGRLSLGGPALQGPAPRDGCGCDAGCAFPTTAFVARFDRERRVVFQAALPGALIVRTSAGPDRSTFLEQGFPVSFRNGWGSKLVDDYRWVLESRSSSGSTQWTRTFDKLDLKSATAFGSDRIAVLVQDPESSILYFMMYRPSFSHAPAAN